MREWSGLLVTGSGVRASQEPDAVTSRLLIEYVGTDFAGWARQPGLRTVEGELGRALAVVLGREAVSLTVGGRTDAGVHAWGQVASYEGEPARVRSLNALLADDVAVLECVAAEPWFDARRDATSRAYCYRVLARRARSAHEHGRALHWPGRLDRGLLDACARALEGTHDFTAFTPTETSHIRFSRDVLSARWTEGAGGDVLSARGTGRAESDVLEFWIEADSFMRHMNRVLVGTMLELASGGARSGAGPPLAEFEALLAGRPRSRAGRTAPAHGLYLVGIGYDGRRVLTRR